MFSVLERNVPELEKCIKPLKKLDMWDPNGLPDRVAKIS